MKRRNLALMSVSGLAMASAGLGFPKPARAALTTADADRLKGELTPLGAVRQGNAAGTIPAWTGESVALPPGPGPFGILPDFFADDAKLFSIDASNYTQYQDRLSVGIVAMIEKFPGFRLDVYPTRRTAIAPPEVYANAYNNVLTAKPVAGGSRLGFTNAYGAPPFPIPDSNDPFEGGAQVMWNHICRWQGVYVHRTLGYHVVVNGQVTLTSTDVDYFRYPYYIPGGSWDTFNGHSLDYLAYVTGPSISEGQIYLVWQSVNASVLPPQTWEYLSGEGRVRRAPELNYDTPSSGSFNLNNFDEYQGFNGALDRYDWKLLGKKEMFIPYNNNKLFLSTPEAALQPSYFDPDLVRWELHRVWEVDGSLHPGDRNVLARRVYYIDEDNWTIALGHAYDANEKLFRVTMTFMEVRPDLPGMRFGNNAIWNMQTGNYVSSYGVWNVAPYNVVLDPSPVPPDKFTPESMAASAQY